MIRSLAGRQALALDQSESMMSRFRILFLFICITTDPAAGVPAFMKHGLDSLLGQYIIPAAFRLDSTLSLLGQYYITTDPAAEVPAFARQSTHDTHGSDSTFSWLKQWISQSAEGVMDQVLEGLKEMSFSFASWLTRSLKADSNTIVPDIPDELNLTAMPKLEVDLESCVNSYILRNVDKQSVLLRAEQRRTELRQLLQLVSNGTFVTAIEIIKDELVHLEAITQCIETGAAIDQHLNLLLHERTREFKTFLELIENRRYTELHRILEMKMESLELKNILKHLSQREQAEVLGKSIQLVGCQQQVENFEKFKRNFIKAKGTPILRKTKQGVKDEKEEFRILLTIRVLWFLLCYCSEGTVWFVDEQLTFGLSSILSEIVLLLGGDIEKNPGPLSGILVY